MQRRTLISADLDMGTRVLKRIVSNPWFDRTADNEAAIAALIVRQMQSGLISEDALYLSCLQAAEQNYRRPSA